MRATAASTTSNWAHPSPVSPLRIAGTPLRSTKMVNRCAGEHHGAELDHFVSSIAANHPRIVSQTIFHEYPVARRKRDKDTLREVAKAQQLDRLCAGGGAKGRNPHLKRVVIKNRDGEEKPVWYNG